MDGHRETVYPEEVYEAFLALQRGEGDWQAHLEDPPADLALVTRAGPAANLFELVSRRPPLVEGSVRVLYARNDLLPLLPEAAGGPKRHGPSVSSDDRQLCFPQRTTLAPEHI